MQELDILLDEPGWQVTSPSAVRIETSESDEATQAKILLGLGEGSVILKPRARDVTSEQTQFFVEASNLYLPGPGVVDGRHQLHVRTSQGQVNDLTVQVPQGLTVSSVEGPVGTWQFDADSGRLELEIEPAQSQAFDVRIQTQRGVDPLPVDLKLAPLVVADAHGQLGLLAVAFGPDAQPERTTPANMSAVSLGDFNPALLAGTEGHAAPRISLWCGRGRNRTACGRC